MTPRFQFRTVPHILFERGAAKDLASAAAGALGDARRVLVVTDAGVRGAGLLDAPLAGLEAAGLEVHVFDRVAPDPPESMILEAADAGRDAGAEAVIGFGGGSPMDTAKVVAVLLGGDQPIASMYGVDQAQGPRLPLVLVPTTSGTGSEVTPIAIVTVGETVKKGISAPTLYADTAVLDPELTLGLPRHVTAATGIDAMVHAIEAYTTRLRKNPVSDALALLALARLHRALERACDEGSDLEARGDMLLGAMFAGQAFANAPVGGVHAMAYPLGGTFHVPHGLSNSVVLPPVLRFNAPAAEKLYAELAAHLGLEPTSAALVAELERLSAAVGIEPRLSHYGVREDHLPAMAREVAANERLLPNNPRDMTYDDIVAMYREIL